MEERKGTVEPSPAENNTYFAAPEKAGPESLLQSVEIISRNPVMDTLLTSVGGLLAVLNEHRQIVAVNDVLLATLGVSDANDLFGLRPGEAIHCVHANDMPGGCGTSMFCATCGAAVAIVSSLCTDQPVERECVIATKRNGRQEELFFRVRCHAIIIEGQTFLLLFLQDMTEHQLHATLERVFLHDLNNIVAGLVGNAELYDTNDEYRPQIADELAQLSLRLAKEIEVHRTILSRSPCEISVDPEELSTSEIGQELSQLFARHAAAGGKYLLVGSQSPDLTVWTDRSLLMRVLANAVTNAFEGCEEGDTVRFWHEETDAGVTFHVWNKSVIPEPVALRVFQMGFTTKDGTGRGIGTYVMKWISEKYLGGRVEFTSSPDNGTEFCLSIPCDFVWVDQQRSRGEMTLRRALG